MLVEELPVRPGHSNVMLITTPTGCHSEALGRRIPRAVLLNGVPLSLDQGRTLTDDERTLFSDQGPRDSSVALLLQNDMVRPSACPENLALPYEANIQIAFAGITLQVLTANGTYDGALSSASVTML